jgi:hypothetical protein
MNLAYRDVRHNLLRFVLTCVGLSLLLGVVITITGVYRGLIDDALRQAVRQTPICGWSKLAPTGLSPNPHAFQTSSRASMAWSAPVPLPTNPCRPS